MPSLHCTLGFDVLLERADILLLNVTLIWIARDFFANNDGGICFEIICNCNSYLALSTSRV